MHGRIVPEAYWGSFEPAWRNFFENTAAVQFHHRVLAVSTLAAVSGYWLAARGRALPPQVKTWTNALLGMAGVQVCEFDDVFHCLLASAAQRGACSEASCGVVCVRQPTHFF